MYASGEALKSTAKAAAIREFVVRWIAANKWAKANPTEWVQAYYVNRQKLKEADGRAIVESEGNYSFPRLESLVSKQQALIDLIHEAGDLPKRLDAREEFDLRFDEIIAGTAG